MSQHRLPSLGEGLLFALVVLLFGVGFIGKLAAPLTYWDTGLLAWAAATAPASGPAGTSPLYLLLLKGLSWMAPLEPAPLRWINAGGALLVGLLTFRLTVRLWGDRRAGWLAFALYLLHPAVVQGSQSLDLADASLYPAFFTLWLLEFLSPASRMGGGGRRAARLAAWAALAMGWKTTSSLGLLLYPFSGIALGWLRQRDTRAQRRDFLATLAGIVVFVAVWRLAPAWGSLETSLATTAAAMKLPSLASIAFRTALGIAWWGPFFAVLAAWSAFSLLGRRTPEMDCLIGGTFLYMTAYLLIGGMNYGFPRYHVAVLPVLCSLVARPEFLPEMKPRPLAALLLLALVSWAWLGDPIHALNLQAREALLGGSLAPFLGRLALVWGIFCVAAVALKSFADASWPKFLLLLTLANIGAIALLQGPAAYATSYGYGEEGRKEVLQWAARHVPPRGALLAPPNLAAGLKDLGLRGMGHKAWKSRRTILAHVADVQPAGVVLSLTENAMWQLEWLLKNPPPPLGFCRGAYRRIGTFWVCSRGNAASP